MRAVKSAWGNLNTDPGVSIGLTAGELSFAVSFIGAKAREAAFKANDECFTSPDWHTKRADPGAQHRLKVMLEKARAYGRLAVDMEYARDIRIPLLPSSTRLELFVDDASRSSFRNAIDCQSFSLEALAEGRFWHEHIAAATDAHIPRWKIHKAATKYRDEAKMWRAMRRQIVDDFSRKAAMEVLGRSLFGADVLKQSIEFGYTHRFIDMRPYNLVSADRDKTPASAVCFPIDDIYVDVNSPDVFRGIKLGHECIHARQYYEHFKFARYKDISPSEKRRTFCTGVNANAKQFTGLMEAHCVGGEYVIGSELLAAGVDAQQIHNSLYGLPPDQVNLLLDQPAEFLWAMSRSEMINERWELKKRETKTSPKMIAQFAESMGKLCEPWPHMPPPQSRYHIEPIGIPL